MSMFPTLSNSASSSDLHNTDRSLRKTPHTVSLPVIPIKQLALSSITDANFSSPPPSTFSAAPINSQKPLPNIAKAVAAQPQTALLSYKPSTPDTGVKSRSLKVGQLVFESRFKEILEANFKAKAGDLVLVGRPLSEQYANPYQPAVLKCVKISHVDSSSLSYDDGEKVSVLASNELLIGIKSEFQPSHAAPSPDQQPPNSAAHVSNPPAAAAAAAPPAASVPTPEEQMSKLRQLISHKFNQTTARKAVSYREALTKEGEAACSMRTSRAIEFAKGFQAYRSDRPSSIFVGEVPYEVITGDITDFTKRPLVSCGMNRELILLDPKKIWRLPDSFTTLKQILDEKLQAGMALSTELILQTVSSYIKNSVFQAEKQPKAVAELVQGARINSRFKRVARKIGKPDEILVPAIPIDEFVRRRTGNSSHQAVVAAFFLDMLTKTQKPGGGTYLEGTVHLMRDELHEAGHAWNVFIPLRKPNSPLEKWFIDSSREEVCNFADKTHCQMLAKLYGAENIQRLIAGTAKSAEANGQL